ncbi:hypothetical protein AB0H83_41945 [Dactylosporangium sp. NPDC050688]|uniref:WXG100-like domain-containing protein n=1 Tax=Dactylosporangium sp. NPDC050688 TaxID=3157217 RepID=UPI0033FDEFC4
MSPVAIQPSREVADFLKVITGEEVPGLNEDRLFAVAQAYHDAATGLTDELAPVVVAAVNGVRQNFSGAGERAFASSMAKFVSEEPRYLYVAAEELNKAGEAARKTALQVQYVKLIIILTIVELMIELAVAAAMAFINPAFMAWFAARSAIVRFFVRTIIGRLILAATTNMVMGIAFQAAMDFLAQRIQIDILHTRRPDEWDWDATRQSVEVGALSGALSFVGGAVGDAVVKGLLKRPPSNLFGRNRAGSVIDTPEPIPTPRAGGGPRTPFVELLTKHGVGERTAKRVEDMVDITNEALLEYVTEGLYGVLKGEGWDASGFALTSGLVSGIAEQSGHKIGKSLGMSYPEFRERVRQSLRLDPTTGAYVGSGSPPPTGDETAWLLGDTDSDDDTASEYDSDNDSLFSNESDESDWPSDPAPSVVDPAKLGTSDVTPVPSGEAPSTSGQSGQGGPNPGHAVATVPDGGPNPASMPGQGVSGQGASEPVQSTVNSATTGSASSTSTSLGGEQSQPSSTESPAPPSGQVPSEVADQVTSTESPATVSSPDASPDAGSLESDSPTLDDQGPPPRSGSDTSPVDGTGVAQPDSGLGPSGDTASGSVATAGFATAGPVFFPVPSFDQDLAKGWRRTKFGSSVLIPSTREGETPEQAQKRWESEVQVARAVPVVEGTVFLHVHRTGDGFAVGDKPLDPAEFADWLVKEKLVEGKQRVVLASCRAGTVQGDATPADGPASGSPAARLTAELYNRGVDVKVVASDADVYASPSGLLYSFTSGFDTTTGQPVLAGAQAGRWKELAVRNQTTGASATVPGTTQNVTAKAVKESSLNPFVPLSRTLSHILVGELPPDGTDLNTMVRWVENDTAPIQAKPVVDVALDTLAEGLPHGFVLSRASGAVILHRAGVEPSAEARAFARPLDSVLTVMIDPSVADLATADAARLAGVAKFLATVPGTSGGIVVRFAGGTKVDVARLLQVSEGLFAGVPQLGVLAVTRNQVIEAPQTMDSRVVPLDVTGEVTFASLAVEYAVSSVPLPSVTPFGLQRTDLGLVAEPTYGLAEGWQAVYEQGIVRVVPPGVVQTGVPLPRPDAVLVVEAGPGVEVPQAVRDWVGRVVRGLPPGDRARVIMPSGFAPEQLAGASVDGVMVTDGSEVGLPGVVLVHNGSLPPEQLTESTRFPSGSKRLSIVVDASVPEAQLVQVLDTLLEEAPDAEVRLSGPTRQPPEAFAELAQRLFKDRSTAVLTIAAGSVEGRPPVSQQWTPLDDQGSVTFAPLATWYAFQAGEPSEPRTPYGLKPADKPGWYHVGEWRAGQVGDDVFVVPRGSVSAVGTQATAGAVGRIRLGVPGVDAPFEAVMLAARMKAGNEVAGIETRGSDAKSEAPASVTGSGSGSAPKRPRRTEPQRAALSLAVPRAGLPVAGVVRSMRIRLAELGEVVQQSEWLALEKKLLTNYRQVVSAGLPVTLGGVEFLVRLDPRNAVQVSDAGNVGASYDSIVPREQQRPVDELAGRKKPEDGAFHANESVQGSFQVGAYSQNWEGRTTTTNVSLGLGFLFQLATGGLPAVRVNPGVSGVANQSNRSMGWVGDAEKARVLDTRETSTLFAYTDPGWQVKLRTDAGQRWDDENIELLEPQDGADGAQPLLLWVQDHHLGTVPEQVTAKNLLDGNENRIPEHFYASYFTRLEKVYDNILDVLRKAKVDVSIGGGVREELAALLWNLEARFDEAVNGQEGAGFLNGGYTFTLHHNGDEVAVVTVHSERGEVGERVGETSDKAHIEMVRTEIAGQSDGHALTQVTGLSAEVGVTTPKPPAQGYDGMILGAGFAGTEWNRTSGLGNTKVGLNVVVTRYVGDTTGTELKVKHTAYVAVRARPDKLYKTDPVPGEVLLRLPEPHAFEYGFPVDKDALLPGHAPDPDDGKVPYDPKAMRRKGVRPGAPVGPLPRHVLHGGPGLSLPMMDRTPLKDVRNRVVGRLQQAGFLPPDLTSPFSVQTSSSGQLPNTALVNSRIENLKVVQKFLSGDSFDAHYNQLQQDGLPFWLMLRDGVGEPRQVRVTVFHKTELTDEVDSRGDSIYAVETTGEFHTVNLTMGLDIVSLHDDGGEKVSGGFKVLFSASEHLPQELKDVLESVNFAVSISRAKGFSERVTFVLNRPELLEYSGPVGKFELPGEVSVRLDFAELQGTQPDSWTSTPVGVTSTVHLLPHLNTGKTTLAKQPKPTPPQAFYRAVFAYATTAGLTEAARRLLGKVLTGPGKPADRAVTTFASHAMVLAHLKEAILQQQGGYTLESTVSPGILKDLHGLLNVNVEVGPSEYVGVTDAGSGFAHGVIELGLSEVVVSKSKGTSWAVELPAGFDNVLPPGDLTMAPGVSGKLGWGHGQGESQKITGGSENINLSFGRVVALQARVTYTLAGALEHYSKLLPSSFDVPPQQVVEGDVGYLLTEPDALAAYGRGMVPLGDEYLSDAMLRWSTGQLVLPGDVVAGVLTRWHTESQPEVPQPKAGVEDSGGLDEAVRLMQIQHWATQLHQRTSDDETDDVVLRLSAEALENFRTAFGIDLSNRKSPHHDKYLPPYLTQAAPQLGHLTTQEITPRDTNGDSFLTIVRGLIEDEAPGLLSKEPGTWSGAGPTVWWRRWVDGRWAMGRLQGGVQMLQSLFAGTRMHQLLDAMLQPGGMSLYLTNEVGWFLADVVKLEFAARFMAPPEFTYFRPNGGEEIYTHNYKGGTTSVSRDFTVAMKSSAGTGFDPGMSASGAVEVSSGHHKATTRAEQETEERTFYSWKGHYELNGTVEFTFAARRLGMPNRPLNNALTTAHRWWKGYRPALPRKVVADVVLGVSKGLAEMAQKFGPDLPPDFVKVELPGDAFIAATSVNAVPEGQLLLKQVFDRRNPLARFLFPDRTGATGIRPNASLDVRLSRGVLTWHLSEATTGQGYELGQVGRPGHSSNRAGFRLTGPLTDLRILGTIDGPDNTTGTGRYSKYQANTVNSGRNDRWRANLSLGFSHTETDVSPTMPDISAPALGTSFGSPMADGSSYNSANRPENHIKQQGPTVLAVLRGVFRLEAKRKDEPILWPFPTRESEYSSEPITGDVFVQLFADEAELLQRRLAEARATALPALQPAPRVPGDAPAFNLYEQLENVGAEGHNATQAAREVATRILGKVRQKPRGKDAGTRWPSWRRRAPHTPTSTFVLNADRDDELRRAYAATLEWAETELGATEAQVASWRVDDTDVAAMQQSISDVYAFYNNAVGAAITAGEPWPTLPAVVPVLGLDPMHTTRIIAHETGRVVELRVTELDGTESVWLLDPDGRVWRRVGADEPAHFTQVDPITLDVLSQDPGRWLTEEELGPVPNLNELLGKAFDDGRAGSRAVDWVVRQIQHTSAGTAPVTVLADRAHAVETVYRAVVTWAAGDPALSLDAGLRADVDDWNTALGDGVPDAAEMEQRLHRFRTAQPPPALLAMAALLNDPVTTARQIAVAMRRTVELHLTELDGTDSVWQVNSAGRVQMVSDDATAMGNDTGLNLYGLLTVAAAEARASALLEPPAKDAGRTVANRVVDHIRRSPTGTGPLTMVASERDALRTVYRAALKSASAQADPSWGPDDPLTVGEMQERLEAISNTLTEDLDPDALEADQRLSELAVLEDLLYQDPVTIARQIAYDIDRPVDLHLTRLDGETVTKRIDPTGRVWRIGDDGVARYETGPETDLYRLLGTAIEMGVDATEAVEQAVDELVTRALVANQVETSYRAALTAVRDHVDSARARGTLPWRGRPGPLLPGQARAGEIPPMLDIATSIDRWHRDLTVGDVPSVTEMRERLDRIRAAALDESYRAALAAARKRVHTDRAAGKLTGGVVKDIIDWHSDLTAGDVPDVAEMRRRLDRIGVNATDTTAGQLLSELDLIEGLVRRVDAAGIAGRIASKTGQAVTLHSTDLSGKTAVVRYVVPADASSAVVIRGAKRPEETSQQEQQRWEEEAKFAEAVSAAVSAADPGTNTVVVQVHEREGRFEVGDELLSPAEFADWLVAKAKVALAGRTRVVLASCRAGAGQGDSTSVDGTARRPVAAEVADKLAKLGITEVLAADGTVFSPGDGRPVLLSVATAVTTDGRMTLAGAQRGAWKLFSVGISPTASSSTAVPATTQAASVEVVQATLPAGHPLARVLIGEAPAQDADLTKMLWWGTRSTPPADDLILPDDGDDLEHGVEVDAQPPAQPTQGKPVPWFVRDEGLPGDGYVSEVIGEAAGVDAAARAGQFRINLPPVEDATVTAADQSRWLGNVIDAFGLNAELPAPVRTPSGVVVVPSVMPGETPEQAQARTTAELEMARTQLPLPEGTAGIHVHPVGDGFRVGNTVLDAQSFIEYLGDVLDGQRQVVLISCDAGSKPQAAPISLAGKVAAELRDRGISVVAPRGVAFLAPALGGRVVAARTKAFTDDGRPVLTDAGPGSWRRFRAAKQDPDGPTRVTVTALDPDDDNDQQLSNVLTTELPGPGTDLTGAVFWTQENSAPGSAVQFGSTVTPHDDAAGPSGVHGAGQVDVSSPVESVPYQLLIRDSGWPGKASSFEHEVGDRLLASSGMRRVALAFFDAGVARMSDATLMLPTGGSRSVERFRTEASTGELIGAVIGGRGRGFAGLPEADLPSSLHGWFDGPSDAGSATLASWRRDARDRRGFLVGDGSGARVREVAQALQAMASLAEGILGEAGLSVAPGGQATPASVLATDLVLAWAAGTGELSTAEVVKVALLVGVPLSERLMASAPPLHTYLTWIVASNADETTVGHLTPPHWDAYIDTYRTWVNKITGGVQVSGPLSPETSFRLEFATTFRDAVEWAAGPTHGRSDMTFADRVASYLERPQVTERGMFFDAKRRTAIRDWIASIDPEGNAALLWSHPAYTLSVFAYTSSEYRLIKSYLRGRHRPVDEQIENLANWAADQILQRSELPPSLTAQPDIQQLFIAPEEGPARRPTDRDAMLVAARKAIRTYLPNLALRTDLLAEMLDYLPRFADEAFHGSDRPVRRREVAWRFPLPGDVFYRPSLQSNSSSWSVAFKYAQSYADNADGPHLPAVFRLSPRPGLGARSIRGLSQWMLEDEVLSPANTSFTLIRSRLRLRRREGGFNLYRELTVEELPTLTPGSRFLGTVVPIAPGVNASALEARTDPPADLDPSSPEQTRASSSMSAGSPDEADAEPSPPKSTPTDPMLPVPARTPGVVVVPSSLPGESPEQVRARVAAEVSMAKQQLPLPEGTVGVHVHPVQDGARVGFRVGEEVLDPESFVEYLGDVLHGADQLVLISCDAGSRPDGALASLAGKVAGLLHERGVSVVAPRGVAFLAPTLGGRVVAAKVKAFTADGRPVLADAELGSWMRFQAQKQEPEGDIQIAVTSLDPDDGKDRQLSNVLTTELPGPGTDLTGAVFWTQENSASSSNLPPGNTADAQIPGQDVSSVEEDVAELRRRFPDLGRSFGGSVARIDDVVARLVSVVRGMRWAPASIPMADVDLLPLVQTRLDPQAQHVTTKHLDELIAGLSPLRLDRDYGKRVPPARVDHLWYRLEDVSRQFFHNRRNVRLRYTVDADGGVLIGIEKAGIAVTTDEVAAQTTALNDDVLDKIGGRVSGELTLTSNDEILVNDRSGWYTQTEVSADVTPASMHRWLSNVVVQVWNRTYIPARYEIVEHVEIPAPMSQNPGSGMGPALSDEYVSKVVGILKLRMDERGGDLDLTYVAPFVNQLPDPAAGWRAVIRSILSKSSLSSRVRTVTDWARMPGSGGGPPAPRVHGKLRDVIKAELPNDVLGMLGLTDVPVESGQWSRGERRRPVRLPALPFSDDVAKKWSD